MSTFKQYHEVAVSQRLIKFKLENLQFQPWNTTRNEYVKVAYEYGVSKVDALSRFLVKLKTEKKYTAPIGVIINSAKNNHPIITVEPEAPQQSYWWNDRD